MTFSPAPDPAAQRRFRSRSALVVITGDDVYEDLFTASRSLQDILAGQGFATRAAMGTAALASQPAAGLIVLYTAMGAFPPPDQLALAEAVRSGTGLIAVHAANVFPTAGGRPADSFGQIFSLIGSRYAAHGPPPHESRFRVQTDPRSDVTRGIPPFEITHEHYHIEVAADAEVIAWRHTPAGREPVAYLRREGAGRVGYLQLGHDMRAWDEPPVRELIRRCARWACGPATGVAA